MYEQSYSTDAVLQPVPEMALRGNERGALLNSDGQPILQQQLYTTQNELTVINDSGVLLPNAPQNPHLLQPAPTVPINQSQSSTFVQQPFLGDAVNEHSISPLMNDRPLHHHEGEFDSSKRIRLVVFLLSERCDGVGRRGK